MTIYAINLWGSHPDEDNDDCWTGWEVGISLAKAKAVFDNPGAPEHFGKQYDSDVAFVELTVIESEDDKSVEDDSVYLVRSNPNYKPYKRDNSWEQEAAMQAGMLGGCAAYNAAKGY